MMTLQSGDEFYIGYEDGMPPGIARRVRAVVASAACLVTAVVLVVIASWSRLPPSTFEYGVAADVSGVLRRAPYPALETPSGRVWLADRGKAGADAALARVPDGPMKAVGSRIHRGRHQMLELHHAVPLRPEGSRPPGVKPLSGVRRLTAATLRGEIVDSKCFLGVMNPAEGAVHRDCARRCLSGGLIPMLLVRGGEHREELVILVSADGRRLPRDAVQIAGVPVEVSGLLTRDGQDWVLYVERWSVLGG